MLNSICLDDYIITSPELENTIMDNLVSWTPADMLEITLNEPDDFLKVRETLTRIGVASRKEQKLFQAEEWPQKKTQKGFVPQRDLLRDTD